MMNSETKRHIDAARQVLVGVVPNPLAQIDQITNALIYKFMDDMDQAAIKAGGEPSFFVNDLERYSWTRLMDARLGNQERRNLYFEALAKFSEAAQLPDLFRDIFKSASLPYNSPETLGLFLKEIDYFDYSHSEELGNAYEYLLSIMSSQGDAGQFRTPRHIIDFIVQIINPTKDDKVLDPACGTGGFLISSYNHILQQSKVDAEKNDCWLTPSERKKLMNNFEGYDVDPTMVRISQVNMYLHHFKNPKVCEYNTLSRDERWNDKFDVILANPPFMSPKGGIKPHSKFSVQSSRSEVLFVDYIMNHLRPRGRAGIIVPEGIIFQSGNAYKQLRKNLVETGLYAVISLPSGVFQPYSGVKTSILLIDNELAKRSNEILFIKVENDGFDLGAQRRPINQNDLPQAVDALRKWKTGEKVDEELALYVEKSKIAESGDYNLSGDRYRVAITSEGSKWPMVKLGDVCDVRDGTHDSPRQVQEGFPLITSKNIKDGEIDFSTASYISEEDFKKVAHRSYVDAGDIIMPMIGTIGGACLVKSKEREFAIKNVALFKKSKIMVPEYLLNILDSDLVSTMLNQQSAGSTQKFVSLSILRGLEIPLPPLEIQKQIVAELDGYSKIINGARQVVENWKPKIDIDPTWETVKLGDVCDFIQRGKSPKYGESTVQVIKSGQARGYYEFDFSAKYFVDKAFKLDHRKLQKGDLLLNSTGVGTAGRITFFDLPGDFLVDSHITILRLKKDLAESKYVLFALDSIYGFKKLESMAKGTGGQIELGLSIIKELLIPLPTLEIQEQIVERIEAERALVESARKLITIYEQKIKDTVAKLWNE